MTRRLATLGVIALLLPGCAEKPRRQEESVDANLRKIGQAYQLFTDWKRRPPQNDDDLKSYFPEIGETGDLDAILRSPRDNQPFVIYYGPRIDADARDAVLAHELTETDGNRHVLTLAGYVKVLTGPEFAAAPMAQAVGKKK